MFNRRATITAMAIPALAASLAAVGLSAVDTAIIAQPAGEGSLTSGPYPAHPAQPWDPNCWRPDGTWNPDCGPAPTWGPGMGPGQWGPGMMGPGMTGGY